MTNPVDQDQYLGLFSFNWLPALYADDGQLAEWASILPATRGPADRLVHRVSRELLERHDLNTCYLPWVPRAVWMLAPQSWLDTAAAEVAVAMASGSVRRALTGEQVSRWVKLIGSQARGRALRYATDYPLLAGEFDRWQPQTRAQLVAGGAIVLQQLAKASLIAEAGERSDAEPARIARAGASRLALRFAPSAVVNASMPADALAQAGCLFDAITSHSTDRELAA